MQGKVAKNKFNTSFSLPQNIKERYRRAAHEIHSSPGAVGGAEPRLPRLTQRPRPRGQRDPDGSAGRERAGPPPSQSSCFQQMPSLGFAGRCQEKATPEPSVLRSGKQCEPGGGAGSAPGYRLLSACHGHSPHPQSANCRCRDTRPTPSNTEPGPLQQGLSRSEAASRAPSHPRENTKRRRMGKRHTRSCSVKYGCEREEKGESLAFPVCHVC